MFFWHKLTKEFLLLANEYSKLKLLNFVLIIESTNKV